MATLYYVLKTWPFLKLARTGTGTLAVYLKWSSHHQDVANRASRRGIGQRRLDICIGWLRTDLVVNRRQGGCSNFWRG